MASTSLLILILVVLVYLLGTVAFRAYFRKALYGSQAQRLISSMVWPIVLYMFLRQRRAARKP